MMWDFCFETAAHPRWPQPVFLLLEGSPARGQGFCASQKPQGLSKDRQQLQIQAGLSMGACGHPWNTGQGTSFSVPGTCVEFETLMSLSGLELSRAGVRQCRTLGPE